MHVFNYMVIYFSLYLEMGQHLETVADGGTHQTTREKRLHSDLLAWGGTRSSGVSGQGSVCSPSAPTPQALKLYQVKRQAHWRKLLVYFLLKMYSKDGQVPFHFVNQVLALLCLLA